MGTDALQPPADGDEEMGRKPQGFFSPFFHPSLGLGRRLTPRQDCVGQGCCPGQVWGPRGGGGRVLQPRAVPPLAGQPLVGLVQSIARLAW